jgi:hypothetical protein
MATNNGHACRLLATQVQWGHNCKGNACTVAGGYKRGASSLAIKNTCGDMALPAPWALRVWARPMQNIKINLIISHGSMQVQLKIRIYDV